LWSYGRTCVQQSAQNGIAENDRRRLTELERVTTPNRRRWARHKDRYAKYLSTLPLVVFVCRDEDSAREFCRAADPVVTACHSYAGEYPGEWDYAGRERMFFVAERAIHEGSLDAYALPLLPPEVRVAQADGDRKAAGCQPRLVTPLSTGRRATPATRAV
jgi:hypothetical protein